MTDDTQAQAPQTPPQAPVEQAPVQAPQEGEAQHVPAEQVTPSPATLPREDDQATLDARQERNDSTTEETPVAQQTAQGPVRDATTSDGESIRVAVPPIQVDGRNRRHGDDGLEGGFVRIATGENAGRVGAFLRVLEHDLDGYPKKILVRTRDEFDQLLEVLYKDVVATNYHGGR